MKKKETNSELLLKSDWDKISIKGIRKTKINAKGIKYVDDKYDNEIITDLYSHFLDNGKNTTESLIISLLTLYGVINVRLRGKTVSFKFENGRVVKVKLTTKDINENDIENIIRMIVSNYVQTRNYKVKELLNSNKNITSCYNSNDSGIKEGNDEYCLELLDERGYAFGLNDYEFFMSLFNELINDCNNKVELEEDCIMVNMNQFDYETPEYQKVINSISTKLDNRILTVVNPSNIIIEKFNQVIKEHNESLEKLNAGNSYVIKEGKGDNNE